MNRASRLLPAPVAGTAAAPVFYLLLFIVQIQNADYACEGFGPTGDYEDVRGRSFEDSYLNLGGQCTCRMDDGSVVITYGPGWWFSGTLIGLAALAVFFARRKGHPGVLFGLATLVAPPLGAALVLAAGAAAGSLKELARRQRFLPKGLEAWRFPGVLFGAG